MLVVALTTLYVIVAFIVACTHNWYLASEGEPRPVASIILGVAWPLVAAVLVPVLVASVIAGVIDAFRVGKP